MYFAVVYEQIVVLKVYSTAVTGTEQCSFAHTRQVRSLPAILPFSIRKPFRPFIRINHCTVRYGTVRYDTDECNIPQCSIALCRIVQ